MPIRAPNSKLTPIEGWDKTGKLPKKRAKNNTERSKPQRLKALRELLVSRCPVVQD